MLELASDKRDEAMTAVSEGCFLSCHSLVLLLPVISIIFIPKVLCMFQG